MPSISVFHVFCLFEIGVSDRTSCSVFVNINTDFVGIFKQMRQIRQAKMSQMITVTVFNQWIILKNHIKFMITGFIIIT